MSAGDYRRLALRLTYVSAGILLAGIFVATQGIAVAGYVAAALILAVWLASGAAFVRRLHDRNRTGWWIIISIGALVVSYYLETLKVSSGWLQSLVLLADILTIGFNLWLLVELYIRRGTAGSNRYGPNPLEQ